MSVGLRVAALVSVSAIVGGIVAVVGTGWLIDQSLRRMKW